MLVVLVKWRLDFKAATNILFLQTWCCSDREQWKMAMEAHFCSDVEAE
jgi:hypothetical protein